MNKLFTQLLESRQITDDFLYPKYENLSNPNLLPDIKKAITRIEKAIKNSEHILIYGDYDVDGVTSSTLMEEALTLAGIKSDNIAIMLPDRFADGYGMSPKIIQKVKDLGSTLVITVDCGSGNYDIIKELNENKVDTIITDHHECPDILPEAIAVINPKRKDLSAQNIPETIKNLAGVGVAFKLAEALKNAKLIPEGQEKWLLDLVILGTICDNMLLTGENRILCYYGMKVIAKTRRKGLKELMRTAGVNPNKITSESIGFQIGPRLNAAGRLETAELSLNLLRTKSSTEAATLTAKLEELNKSRRIEQRSATDEIAAHEQSKHPVIIETGTWHEGILGIVAGRLVESFHKPAFVLTELPGDILKGSGRSFGDFNLAEALDYVRDIIIGGGGHAGAAGIRLYKKNLEDFTIKINEYYNSLNLKNQEKYFATTADIATENAKDFTLDLLDDLKLLEPYGAGNEEPVFVIENASILNIKHMGSNNQHLRLDLKSKDGKIIKCVAFSAPEKWFNLYDDENYDFVVKPVENNWNGVRSIEARLLDIVPRQ